MSSTAVDTARSASNTTRPYGRRGRGNKGRGAKAGWAPRNVNTSQSENDKSPTPRNDSEVEENAEEQLVSPVDGEQDGAGICWICAEKIKYYCVSECNHRMCHECALRLRALYKKYECAFCKHPQPSVVFTASADKPFAEFDLDSMKNKDVKLSIYFETEDMMEDTFVKLRYNCPDPDCEYFASSGWNDLKAHIRAIHSRSLCELCIRFKKVFVHEHTLYTRAQLVQHLPSLLHRSGSGPAKGKADDGAHPMCEFCRECFFGDDELFVHMRERHEECFVCKKAGIRDQYFRNYDSLEEHFRKDHYPCTHSECLAKKFIVFGSSMDLQAHMVDEHGATMSARDKKEARRVVAEFDFDEIPGSGGRRRREREPPPLQASQSQAAPRSNRRDGFGAALTTTNPQPLGSTQSANPQQSLVPEITPSQGVVNATRESPPPSEPVDPEVSQRHAAFISRFNAHTNGSTSALHAAKAAIRSFRVSESNARDLITTIYSILEQDLKTTSCIIGSIADILDDESKKNELLSSLNGFKVEQRNQFPDLIPVMQGSAYSGVASGRALNMKHASAARSSTRVWDRVAQAAGATPPRAGGSAGPSMSNVERFPALTNPSSVVPAFRHAQRTTPWASSSAASAAVAATAVSSRIASEPRVNPKQKQAAPSLSSSAFPSLPTANQRNKLTLSGNQSLKNILNNNGPAPNAWTASNSASGANNTAPSPAVGEASTEAGGGKGKKKKGKEKVTLFTLGTMAQT